MVIVDAPREMLDQPEYRVEGPLKVTGAARYTADVRMPGMLYLAYARSPLPHARIVSIDTSAAKAVPGVHAVLTGADIGFVGLGRQTAGLAGAGDRPGADDRRSRRRRRRREQGRRRGGRAPGRGRVRGAAARHASRTRSIRTRRSSIPMPRATRSWGRSGRRRPTRTCTATSLIQKSETGESIEDVFARADHVFEHTFTMAREFQGFIEPRACVRLDRRGRSRPHHQHEQGAGAVPPAARGRAGHPGGPDRRRHHVHRRRFRRQGPLDRRVRLLLPGARDRPADQGGDELPRRDAGEQLAPSGDHEAADRRRP